ncbi:MAG: c-type cytochrome [Gemmataceae bacterium]|nr:c-type cytochrome [Gemmataceae bacterium]
MRRATTLFALFLGVSACAGAEPTAAERGKRALESKAFIPSFWPRAAYDLAWKQWGIAEKPTDYAAAFNERYGLHAAPYANDGLPMGLRAAPYLPLVKGIALDCMTCHGGSILGKSIVGLGNASMDIQSLFEDLYVAGKIPAKLPFTFTQTRGTNEAGAFSVYLLGYRNDDLSLRESLRDLGLKDDSCEDVPAWWLLKKKKTMYHVGATDARSVRSLMQFMMHPLTLPKDFERAEPDFRDIQAYLLSLEPPKYPFPINAKLAARGQTVFESNCAKCHGSYGEHATYPNKIVPLDEIGTDRTRFDNIGVKFGEAYAASWFAKESPPRPIRATAGYQAPPLDGVWATAPYFHNGSVPTLEGVLNSHTRPKRFTRSFRTNEEDYDKDHVGWKVTEVEPAARKLSPYERRKIYDTTERGRGNAGHTYGDDLSADDRRALIEYLKTL